MLTPTVTTHELLRIGALAERTGISAKALRLYEQRGLLVPTTRTRTGYRLYGPDALARLMQILMLKRTGFSLAEIGRLLADHPDATAVLLAGRICALEHDLSIKTQTLHVLRAVADRAASASSLNAAELLEGIAMTQHLKMEMTNTERDAFKARLESLGAEGVDDAQRAWPELIANVRAAMDAGTPATNPEVAELGRRWHALVQKATGGDQGMNRRLGEAYVQQPDAMAAYGMDTKMFEYIGRAMQAAGVSLFK